MSVCRPPAARLWHIALSLAALFLLPAGAAGQASKDPLAPVDRALAAAEAGLRAGELQIAESRYHSVLFEAWMATGGLDVAAGRWREARDAFRQASRSAVDAEAAFRSLALMHLQLGEAAEAAAIMTRLAGRAPGDVQARRLLAQALVANGQPEEAVQTLEEARAAAPDDPEIAFLLASGYLHLKKVDAAERLFGDVVAARPIPQTWVLIGRTYRDFRMYDRARAALTTALKKDSRVRRAHYYLGTIAVMSEGVVRLDEAIREFREELKLAPADAATNLRLGMALVEAQRPSEALPALEIAARTTSSAESWHYLGRCQLSLDRAADAVASLRRALKLAEAGGDESRVRNIHYQLALALRRTGDSAGAEVHFGKAKEASARRADAEREQLGRYLADTAHPDPEAAAPVALDSPFAALAPAARADLERRVKTALARAYLNLGVMRAQAQQFSRAAELFEEGAAVDPGFPQLQYSLGVTLFNAQQHKKAAVPLARALAADPGNADARRMLALAHLNAGAYAQAAALLVGDSRLDSDPSLQYAYGLALARSERGAEAEAVFSRLLAQHGDRAELHVILGQAHAQQGDFEAAVQSLERARQLKPGVADAGATLGMIYLKQGRLSEAAVALREELRANAGNLSARHTLATVLDLDGHSEEAVTLLRSVLEEKPDFGDARYLLGKILVARGDSAAAVQHLEAAVRLSPDDSSYHYQLAQAYQKLGRRDLAEKHLTMFRELKDKRRGGSP
ncbi:MAG: tetratricopeptide repeat protein [Acidobacteria bacterium]|nr:tetratricopeptide repeat protein [Acidobacteriota bacterium]